MRPTEGAPVTFAFTAPSCDSKQRPGSPAVPLPGLRGTSVRQSGQPRVPKARRTGPTASPAPPVRAPEAPRWTRDQTPFAAPAWCPWLAGSFRSQAPRPFRMRSRLRLPVAASYSPWQRAAPSDGRKVARFAAQSMLSRRVLARVPQCLTTSREFKRGIPRSGHWAAV